MNFRSALITALCLLTTLSGCTSTKDKVPTIQFSGPALPAMPESYTRNIADPGPGTEGQDARAVLLKNREWAKALRDQHGRIVVWYAKVRAAQPK